jgi:hypothetical protein
MPDGGYGAGLFDSEGPKRFGEEVGKISGAVSGVQSAFTNFGTTAKQILGDISSAVDTLNKSMQNMQNNLQGAISTLGGLGGGGGGGMGAPSPGGPSGKTGDAADTTMQMPNATQPGDQGFKGTPSMDQGTASRGTGSSFPQQQSGTAAMAQRAADSMIPAAVGAGAKYAQGLVSQAVQGQTIAQMIAPAAGVSQRSLYQQPAGVLTQQPSDFAQSNLYMAMNMGIVPGSAQGANAWRQAGNLMTLVPNMSPQQAMQTQLQSMAPQTLNQEMAYGFNFSPGGKQLTGTAQYVQIFDFMSRNVGGKPSYAQFEEWMKPGHPWAANLEQVFGLAPGSAGYEAFWSYATQRIAMQNQGKKLGRGGTDISGTPAAGSTYMQQLKAQSAKGRAESQFFPALGQTARDLSVLGQAGWGAAASVLSPLTGGGGPGGWSPLSGFLPGGGILGKLLSPMGGLGGGGGLGSIGGLLGGGGLGQLGGLLHGFGGLGGLGSLFGGGGGLGSLLKLSPMGLLGGGGAGHLLGGAGHMLGSIGGHIGGFLGGLLGGTPAGAAEPKHSQPKTAEKTSAHHLLEKPPRDSVLYALTQPVQKGQNTLAAALVFGLTGGKGSGTGMPGAGGGVGGPITGFLTRGNLSTTSDASGMFKVTQTSGGSSGGSSSTGGGNAGSASGAGNTGAFSGTIPAGGDYNQTTWAQALLAAIGAPTSSSNVNSIVTWENREGGNWHNTAKYNPLNTTYPMPGSSNMNNLGGGQGVQAYTSWQQGLEATVDTLKSSSYSDIVGALQAGKGLSGASYKGLSTWSGGGYSSLARGSQLVARTQLALLHQGEAVLPAADNYSRSPYNRGGGMGGGGAPVTHLNFNQGSVVLQVPSGASAQDMENLATQFVGAVSKRTIIAGVRST